VVGEGVAEEVAGWVDLVVLVVLAIRSAGQRCSINSAAL
jgi:hypothetical protein